MNVKLSIILGSENFSRNQRIFYWHTLLHIGTWVSNYICICLLDIITHQCPSSRCGSEWVITSESFMWIKLHIGALNTLLVRLILNNYNTRLTQKSPVRQQNAWFDTKKPGSTQKCPVPHKNALPSMHQLTLPLSNIPRPSCEKYFFPILFQYFVFKNQ